MNLISGIDVSAGALNAQKTRLDIVAQNIANAQTTRTPSGAPYQRQVVSFESELLKRSTGGASLQTVRIGSISTDRTPGQQVYNPQHPDAGPDGNTVEIEREMLVMNRNVVEHDFLTEIVSRNIKQLKMAITGRQV